ncbi:MAG: GAF domain-containing protein [Chloroflexi bacterium]|nr:MAG: GAF domain-containing protein [Chloroflexota bacterium]
MEKMMNEEKVTVWERIKARIAPPVFADEEKNRVSALLNFLTIFYLVIMGISFASVFAFGGEDLPANLRGTVIRLTPYATMIILVQIMMRRGFVLGASKLFVAVYWLNITFEVVTGGGVFAPAFASYLIAVVIAGLLAGVRAALITGACSLFAAVFVAAIQDRLPAPLIPLNVTNEVVSAWVAITVAIVMLFLYVRRLDETLSRLRAANAELEMASQVLEQRVTDRTRALTLSAEVSSRLSTILDQDQLTREVVNQLQQAFDYYHVHIYLLDEARQNLVMTGGTGEAGQVMLARRHKIIAGRGLVGRAAETNQPVLVGDTTQDPGWLPNPLLPETKSELAVPISYGERVLGVLDVQQNAVGGLTPADVDLIQLVANQVAIALQNAWAFMKSQQRAEREALVVKLSQKIQQAATIEDVLKVAVSGLGQGLGAQHSSVELRSKAAGGKN